MNKKSSNATQTRKVKSHLNFLLFRDRQCLAMYGGGGSGGDGSGGDSEVMSAAPLCTICRTRDTHSFPFAQCYSFHATGRRFRPDVAIDLTDVADVAMCSQRCRESRVACKSFAYRYLHLCRISQKQLVLLSPLDLEEEVVYTTSGISLTPCRSFCGG